MQHEANGVERLLAKAQIDCAASFKPAAGRAPIAWEEERADGTWLA